MNLSDVLLRTRLHRFLVFSGNIHDYSIKNFFHSKIKLYLIIVSQMIFPISSVRASMYHDTFKNQTVQQKLLSWTPNTCKIDRRCYVSRIYSNGAKSISIDSFLTSVSAPIMENVVTPVEL